MYIVLDLEFYHNTKKEQLGPVKQIGAFKFDDDYRIIDIFEMTVTKYTTQAMLTQLFTNFVKDVSTMYVWAKNNDLRAMKSVLDINAHDIKVIDVQEYFKEVNLASLSTISEALSFDSEGRHNALIDAEYTFEIVKHFELNNEVSRKAISNYINLIRSNESNQRKVIEPKKIESKEFVKKELKTETNKNDYKIVTAGSMRKLNDDYYQIVSESSIKQIINDIQDRNLPICKDGKFELNSDLESQVKSRAIIVFTNATKFKEVAKKHEDKLIVVVDHSTVDNYLAIFISKKVYRKFIK